MKKVAKKLRQAVLEHRKLSVTEAAEKIGIGRPALSNVLNGNAALSIELALKLEKLFGVDARRMLIEQLDEDIMEAKNA